MNILICGWPGNDRVLAMTRSADAPSLFRQAADLAIRLQNDPANPAELEAVRAFIASGTEHRAAWTRVSSIHGMTGKVLSDRQRADSLMSRRNLMIAGVLAIGGAAGLSYLPDMLLSARVDYRTTTGRQQRIVLSDGSVVTLGPESAIAIHMTDEARRIDLLQGMGFFEVAPDPTRPFTVTGGRVSVTALGTAFDVSIDASYVSVAVDHGRVQVGEARVLEAGDWLTLDPEADVASRGHRQSDEIASWRRGMIIADSETVAALVARIGRWHEGRVMIADPWLGSREVSGVFDLNDSFSALQAVVKPFGAKVRQLAPFLTVISAI